VAPAVVTAPFQEGRWVTVEVEFQDPVVPAWDDTLHPSMRRKLERQRTVRGTWVATRRQHVGVGEFDVRIDTGCGPRPGWVVPAAPPGFAMMGDLRSFSGWHVRVMRGATGSLDLEAPAWWGQAPQPVGGSDEEVRPAEGDAHRHPRVRARSRRPPRGWNRRVIRNVRPVVVPRAAPRRGT
jgi:hypothetical protein